MPDIVWTHPVPSCRLEGWDPFGRGKGHFILVSFFFPDGMMAVEVPEPNYTVLTGRPYQLHVTVKVRA